MHPLGQNIYHPIFTPIEANPFTWSRTTVKTKVSGSGCDSLTTPYQHCQIQTLLYFTQPDIVDVGCLTANTGFKGVINVLTNIAEYRLPVFHSNTDLKRTTPY